MCVHALLQVKLIWEGKGCIGCKSPCVREFDGVVCIARFNLVGFYICIMDFIYLFLLYVGVIVGFVCDMWGLVGCVCILWMRGMVKCIDIIMAIQVLGCSI